MGRAKRPKKRLAAADRPAESPPAAWADRLQPWLAGAACALFVTRPMFPSDSEAGPAGDGLPVVMLWLALALFWLLTVLGRRRAAVRVGWAELGVAGLVAWHAVSAAWAVGHASPRPAVNMLWEWVGLGISFFLARQLLVGPRTIRAAAAVMVALAVALAGYGLYQYAVEMPAARAEYDRDPQATMRRAGVNASVDSREGKLFHDRVKSTEPMGTFALTNSLAALLTPWMVVAVGIAAGCAVGGMKGTIRVGGAISVAFRSAKDVAFAERKATDAEVVLRWLLVAAGAAACAMLIAACLILTKSRSAYLAAMAGVTLLAIGYWRSAGRIGWKLPLGVAGVAAVLVAAAIAAKGLDVLVLLEAPKSLGYRFQYWQATLGMIGDHPLVGCGPGNFQDAYTAYMLPVASEEIGDPHNFLLEVWATAGTPALLALLGVLGYFAWAVLGLRRTRLPVAADLLPEPPARRKVSPPDEACRPIDSPTAVYWGAACGLVASLGLGMLGSAPPGFSAVLVGLPLGAGAVALLSGWVENGQFTPRLAAVGVVVLLVDLLATGGIGYAGVAGSLWLLMALGLNAGADARWRNFPQPAAWATMAIALIAFILCYTAAYDPVLTCKGLMARAEREPLSAEIRLVEAAAADPLSAEPYRHLALVALGRWQADPTPEAFRTVEAYQSGVERLAPNSSAAWFVAGEQDFAAFQRMGGADYLTRAIAAYRRAVDLYPTNAWYHARLALAHRAGGDQAGFRREAEEALRLDRVTPHKDRKLTDELRAELKRSLLQGQGA